MLEIIANDSIAHRGDANASSGKDGVAARTMIHSSAMCYGQGGVPPELASLPLGGKKRRVGKEFGLLGNNNVRRGSAKQSMLK